MNRKILIILVFSLLFHIGLSAQILWTKENFEIYKNLYKIKALENKMPYSYSSVDSIILSKDFYKVAKKDSMKNAGDIYEEFSNADSLNDTFDNLEHNSYIRRIPQRVNFEAGEYLKFDIYYGVFHGGTGILEIKEDEDIRGEECFHFHSRGYTNKFISMFFEVDDKIDSYMSKENFYSLRYNKNMHEGHYKKKKNAEFYPDSLKSVYNNNKSYITVPYALDVLSAFYYVRSMDLFPGDTIVIDTHELGKNYPLLVKVIAIEDLELDGKVYNTIKIEPRLRGEGVFRQKGKVFIWLTNDKYKTPVFLKAKIVADVKGKGLSLGSVKAYISKIKYKK